MVKISVILICVITLIMLKFLLSINFKNIKNLKIRKSEELEDLTSKFPDDEKICKDILGKLKNENTKIKLEPEYSSCLYIIFNNTITIGKFQQAYMKIQTIAHECVHSNQDKITLWSNFIITNIYLIYFIVILILGFFNKLAYSEVHIIVLIFLSFIQYIIRFSLENEAMIKARFIAKEYIEENKILNKNEKEKLLSEYDEINNIGIPFMNYYTISMNIIKIMLFAFVSLI